MSTKSSRLMHMIGRLLSANRRARQDAAERMGASQVSERRKNSSCDYPPRRNLSMVAVLAWALFFSVFLPAEGRAGELILGYSNGENANGQAVQFLETAFKFSLSEKFDWLSMEALASVTQEPSPRVLGSLFLGQTVRAGSIYLHTAGGISYDVVSKKTAPSMKALVGLREPDHALGAGLLVHSFKNEPSIPRLSILVEFTLGL